MSSTSLRHIPAVNKVLDALGEIALPRPLVLAAVRERLDDLREAGEIPAFDGIVEDIQQVLGGITRSRIQPLINGTGVLIHTNLGRTPLGRKAVEALTDMASNYNSLEFDLVRGERGNRGAYIERCLAMLCETEAATAVNNNAAALVLILRHFCRDERQEVVISRGELVQIGGGFRIPDILEASGATLREVGTTNKTGLEDYAAAIGPHTAMILTVHRSNFFMEGFVASPDKGELAALATEHGIPLVEDLGSGAMVDTEQLGLVDHEPTPAEVLRHADLVCFSGDKLFGGPQAGMIAGKRELVAGLKKEPFFRALRCDKMILATLQSVIESYLHDTQVSEVPILIQLQQSVETLRERAEKIVAAVPGVTIGSGESRVGGGTMPQSSIPSVTLEIAHEEVAADLREADPPVIGYVSDKRFKLDLRTIFPRQDEQVIAALRTVLHDD